MEQSSRAHDWFDSSTRVKPYPSPGAEGPSEPSTGESRSREEDDIDVDNVRDNGPTQPDQRVPCRWGSLTAAVSYDGALVVLEDAINRFTDLLRVSFNESGLQLSGPSGARIVWRVQDILRQKTTENLFDDCITLSKRLYELIDDYNTLAEELGTEFAMEALFERVQEPDGLVSAVWAVVGPQSSVSEIRLAIQRADKLADIATKSSPDKTKEWERAKEQISAAECQTIEEMSEQLDGAYNLSKPTVVMAALASTDRIWNTDPETKSILTAMSPHGIEIGEYYPLSTNQRDQLFISVEVGEALRRLLVDGVTWVVPGEVKNTRQRLMTLYRRAYTPPSRSIGLIWKRFSELRELTDEAATALQDLKSIDSAWGQDLHNDLRDCVMRELSPMGHEVAKVVEAARDAWKEEYGVIDPAVEVVMGAVNVIYSFMLRPEDASEFCELHYSRCLRMVGPHTLIDSVPLYKWDRTEGDSSIRAQVAKEVAEQEAGVTRSVDEIPLLPYRIGYVSTWREYAQKASIPQEAE